MWVIRGVHIEPAHIVKKRSIDQPLRISIFYDHSVYRLEPEKFDMINNTILPEAVKFWEKALRVRKTGGPIKLNSSSTLLHKDAIVKKSRNL
ncbi:unnamed protein product [Spodoptera exigua]|nr:unnamed protein product [Spodoptera exigua]